MPAGGASLTRRQVTLAPRSGGVASRANGNVSFGARFPFEAQVPAGETVNFVIAGFHHLLIYGPGTQFGDINGTLTVPIPRAPAGFPQVVDDPANRVYRGRSPFGLPQNRVEAVHFATPGRYLVVCGFVPHFDDRKFGYVRVRE